MGQWPWWKVPVFQEILNTGMNSLYVKGFDDHVITEMINMLCKCNDQGCLFDLFFFCKTIHSKYLNIFKLHNLYMNA